MVNQCKKACCSKFKKFSTAITISLSIFIYFRLVDKQWVESKVQLLFENKEYFG